jgi:hypothetical protein
LKSTFKTECDPGDICWRSKQAKTGLYYRGCASRSCIPTYKTLSIIIKNNNNNSNLTNQTSSSSLILDEVIESKRQQSFLNNICCLKDYCNKAITIKKINNTFNLILLALLLFFYYLY